MLHSNHLWSLFATDKSPLPHFVKAKDWYYLDIDNKKYIDGVSGHWSAILGHSEGSVKNAIFKQMTKLDFVPLARATHPPAVKLAEKLASLAPGDLNHTFLGTSGTEAVEAAIKFSRLYFHRLGMSEKKKILYLDKAYHGSTLGSLSASGDKVDHELFGPLLENFLPVPTPNCQNCTCSKEAGNSLGCVDAIIDVIKSEDPQTIAAIIIEPIIGSGGILIPEKGYLRQIRDLCDRYHILFIADEVSTGIGRTGTLFRVQTEDVVPDILVLGKGITAAYFPLSATIVRKEIYETCTKGGSLQVPHDYTCGGHPAGCAAALEVLRYIEENDVLTTVQLSGKHLLNRLQFLKSSSYVNEVRGIGLMCAIELNLDSIDYHDLDTPRMLHRNFLHEGLLCSSGKIIKLLPPFITPITVLDEIAGIVERVIETTFAEK